MSLFSKIRTPCEPKSLAQWLIEHYRTFEPLTPEVPYIGKERALAAMLFEKRSDATGIAKTLGISREDYMMAFSSILDVISLVIRVERREIDDDHKAHLYTDTLRELVSYKDPRPNILNLVQEKFEIIRFEINNARIGQDFESVTAQYNRLGAKKEFFTKLNNLAEHHTSSYKAELQKALEYLLIYHSDDSPANEESDLHGFRLVTRGFVSAALDQKP